MNAALREDGLFVEDLAAHDLVDPGLVDLQLAQLVGDLDGVAAGAEVRRRALQHRDVRAVGGDRRDQRRRGRAGADHDDLLARVVEILRPGLRVDDAALEVVHALPLRRVALRVAVVALAHPQEVGGEAQRLAGVGARGVDGPAGCPRSTSARASIGGGSGCGGRGRSPRSPRPCSCRISAAVAIGAPVHGLKR